MKILNVWCYFHPELKYHIHFLMNEMQRSNHDVSLLASDKVKNEWKDFVDAKSFKHGVEEIEGVNIIRISTFRFLNKTFPLRLWSLSRFLKKEQPDVIHLFGLSSPFNHIVYFLLKIIGLKALIVANDHSNPNQEDGSMLGKIFYKYSKFMVKSMRNSLKRIYVPNLETCEYLKGKYQLNDDLVKIVPLGYNESTFYYDQVKKNKSKKFVIGFAGKVNRKKNLSLLLEAIRKSKYSSEITCELAGFHKKDDYFLELKKYATDHNLEVEYLPLLTPDKLADFYNKIDLAVFPGSISITTLEATGCGTPILLFNSIRGLEDRVSDNRGRLFKELDELVEGIEYYFEQFQKNEIDNFEIENSSKKYSWQKICRLYTDDYNLLNNEN